MSSSGKVVKIFNPAALLVVSMMAGAALFLASWSVGKLRDDRQLYDSLSAERLAISRTIQALELRISDLDKLPTFLASDFTVPDVSSLRTLLNFSSVNLLSMSENGDTELLLKLKGDYYEIANFLAEIRTSKIVVRTSHFNLKSDPDAVEADLTLELLPRMTEE